MLTHSSEILSVILSEALTSATPTFTHTYRYHNPDRALDPVHECIWVDSQEGDYELALDVDRTQLHDVAYDLDQERGSIAER